MPETLTWRVLGQIHTEGYERTVEFWARRLEAKLAPSDAFSRERLRQFAAAAQHRGREPVVDPMCGAGTFVIEAAEIATGLAPGRGRAVEGLLAARLACAEPEVEVAADELREFVKSQVAARTEQIAAKINDRLAGGKQDHEVPSENSWAPCARVVQAAAPMGLLGGSVSYTRFYVRGDAPSGNFRSRFEKAVADSKKLTERPDNATLLKLYALYKQATEGDVEGKRPGFTDMVGRAKFDSWAEAKGKSADDAMQEYVDLIESLK